MNKTYFYKIMVGSYEESITLWFHSETKYNHEEFENIVIEMFIDAIGCVDKPDEYMNIMDVANAIEKFKHFGGRWNLNPLCPSVKPICLWGWNRPFSNEGLWEEQSIGLDVRINERLKGAYGYLYKKDE